MFLFQCFDRETARGVVAHECVWNTLAILGSLPLEPCKGAAFLLGLDYAERHPVDKQKIVGFPKPSSKWKLADSDTSTCLEVRLIPALYEPSCCLVTDRYSFLLVPRVPKTWKAGL